MGTLDCGQLGSGGHIATCNIFLEFGSAGPEKKGKVFMTETMAVLSSDPGWVRPAGRGAPEKRAREARRPSGGAEGGGEALAALVPDAATLRTRPLSAGRYTCG